MNKELPQDKGYILIHRKILDWEWWEDQNTTRLFFYLLLTANWKDKKWRGKEIKRGQLITGIFKLSTATGLSVQQTRTALNKLKSTNELTIKTTNEYSLVTVNNYNNYQTSTNQLTNEQQTNNKRITTTNTLNTLKEDIEKKKYNKISSLDREVVREISKKYNISILDVKNKIEDIRYYLEKNNFKETKYKNYKAVLSNWIRKDIASGKIKTLGVEGIDYIT